MRYMTKLLADVVFLFIQYIVVAFIGYQQEQYYNVQIYADRANLWSGWKLQYDINKINALYPGLVSPVGDGYGFLDEPSYEHWCKLQNKESHLGLFRNLYQFWLEMNNVWINIPPCIKNSKVDEPLRFHNGKLLTKGSYFFCYGYQEVEQHHPFQLFDASSNIIHDPIYDFFVQLKSNSWIIAFPKQVNESYNIEIMEVVNPLNQLVIKIPQRTERCILNSDNELIRELPFGSYLFSTKTGHLLLMSVGKTREDSHLRVFCGFLEEYIYSFIYFFQILFVVVF